MPPLPEHEEKKARIQAKLQKALELEWATIPPYLVAYYSLRPETNREVAGLIKSVFMEEMLHMVLAANLLSATGGKPRLGADNLPSYPLRLEFEGTQFADRRFDIHLAAFSEQSIETFLAIELPQELFQQKEAAMLAEIRVEGSTIGEFYDGIKSDLKELCEAAGEAFVFSGKREHQVPEHFYWSAGGGIIQVTNLATAFEALDVIVDQGEGNAGTIGTGQAGYFSEPTDVAHYFRFNEIKFGRHYAANDLPGDEPTGPRFPVDFKGVYPIRTDCKPQDFAGDATLAQLSERFNRTYTLMLQELEAAFNGNPEVLFTAIRDGMGGLGDLAVAMMQMPLPDGSGEHAAPIFGWQPSPGAPAAVATADHARFANGAAVASPAMVEFSADVSQDLRAGLAALEANAGRPYYEEQRDRAERDAYYAGVDWDAGAEDLFDQLSDLLESSHQPRLGYKPQVELYPWVDLREDGSILSIYSGRSHSPEELIRLDAEVDAVRQTRLNAHLALHGTAFAALAAAIDDLEERFPYNCEHTVPQSWFSKRAPMKGDLHHLFACEINCNSMRGNSPYFDYTLSGPKVKSHCGSSGPQGFEPEAGKGAVARANLYFLLRYPSEIGNAGRELHEDGLATLLAWHEAEPVGTYERHRNQAICEKQGNRNPLIDFPEHAARIAFARGFGRV